MINLRVAAIVLLSIASIAATPRQAWSREPDPAYLATVRSRADKVLAPLGIEDDDKRARVREIISRHYVALNEIDEQRSDESRGANPDAPNELKTAQDEAALFRLHRTFVAQLGSELTPEQVDRVKDGMTYNVAPITLDRYLQLLPDLTAEQQAVVRAHLLEAREYALDAGSSEKKHAWFGEYKGRINNYLSGLGYDLKQAERQLAEREKASAATAQDKR